jgi:hypothetical protein
MRAAPREAARAKGESHAAHPSEVPPRVANDRRRGLLPFAPLPAAAQKAKTRKAAPPPAGTAAAKTAAVPAGRRVRHPAGFAVTLPAGWTSRTGSDGQGLVLVPPETPENELYLLVDEDGSGIASARDDRFVPLLEQGIRALFPTLERSGGVSEIKTRSGGPGVALTFAGATPDGEAVRAHVYGTILRGRTVLLLAMGAPERLARREGVVRPCSPASPRTRPRPQRRSSRRAAKRRRQGPGRWFAARPRVAAAAERHDPDADRALRRRDRGRGYLKKQLTLLPTGRFTYYDENSLAADVGDVSASSGGVGRAAGTWRIVSRGGQAILELRPDGGGQPSLQGVLSDQGGGAYLNGDRVYVTR